MIKVERLTKRYASHTAVRDLSFTVERGEIVGFLGPNGAGKSTTMRILTCFLPATSGRATVAGYDVFTQSLEVRRHLGYLPENVPLYTDLRVNEYLTHRGALKGLGGARLRERLGAVKELVELREVENKVISKLSKGYRQRGGRADALLHEPDLLVLDEPTIGLDPNQIRLARDLIKNLGQRHTILLSTHILPEVEMTCSRVVIINRGRIVATGRPQELPGTLRSTGNVYLEAHAGADDAAVELRRVAGIKEVTPEEGAPAAPPSLSGADPGAGAAPPADAPPSTAAPAPAGNPPPGDDGFRRYRLRVEAGSDPRVELYQLAVARGWKLRELSQRRATLEDVFVELTHADAA